MNRLSCLLAASVAIGTWGTMAIAASLSGEVRIEGRKRLRNLVVYLEAASEATRVEATRHARITQRGRTFSPQTIVIVKGGEIEFVNDEEREIDSRRFEREGLIDVALPIGHHRDAERPRSASSATFALKPAVNRRRVVISYPSVNRWNTP